jgi:hypothetical protein
MSVTRVSRTAGLVMLSTPAPTPRDGFRVSAQQLLNGFETLAQQNPPPWMACAVLAGFAVECALKAYLAGGFVSAGALAKRPYGHNLTALWKEAVKSGLKVAKRPPSWCVALHQLTTGPKFLARYHTGVHGLSFPPMGRMLRGIRRLLLSVESTFR